MTQERKRILEMVQDGKLSAQEAIILLEALDQGNDAEKAPNETVYEKSDHAGEKQTHEGRQNEQKKSAENANEDTFYSQLETAGEKIFDFVNNALKKIRHIDLQFNQSVEFPHVFQQADDNFERIEVDVANGPVKLIAWDQPEVRIECQAKVYRSDDREEARTYFLDNTIFSIDNEMLCFATQSKWMRVETIIYVPKKHFKKLSVRIFNGGLTGEQLQCDHLSVKTTNGKIDLTQLEGNHFDIETVNGQINLVASKADHIEAETVNGAIDVSGFFRNAVLQSFNGNITCSVAEAGSDKIEAKAVTGNIQLHLPEIATVDGDVRSNLGSYKLELEGINVLHEKKEIIQKQVKFKRAGTDEKVLHVLADTKTGSILVKKAD